MKVGLSDRQQEILRRLRDKDAGENAAAFDKLENGMETSSEIEIICNIINAEFMMEGISPTYEPNDYGIELENLLDLINRARLKPGPQ